MNTKLLLALISITGLFLLSMPANAETGSVAVSTSEFYNNYVFGSPQTWTSITWNRFYFDNSDYNTIVNMSIIANGAFTYPNQSNVSSFTCTSGCTGGGYVSYSQALDKISWLWSSGSVITAHEVTLSYQENIFYKVEPSGAYALTGDANTETSTTKPWGISTNNDLIVKYVQTAIGGENIKTLNYGIDVSSSATVSYNITYPTPGWYHFFVDKSGNTVATRAFFHSETNNTLSRAWETTFTTTNFSGSAQYTDGLYLNLSLAGGQYNNVLINATGGTTGSTSQDNATTTGGGGSPSGQIYFDAANMRIGNNYGVNVSLAAANFSSFNAYYIDVFSPSGEKSGFPVEFGEQTYSTGRLWTFDETGIWYANLSYCSYINFLCPSITAPTLIDTAILTLTPVSYTYNVTTDKPNYGFNDNITITATNPSLSTVYLTALGPMGASPQLITEIAWNTPIAPNSVKVFNASISPAYVIGTYHINMLTSQLTLSGDTGRVARAVFNITMPSATSNTLGVSWNDLYPTLGKSDILSYTSNYNISTVTIYNTDQNNLKTAVRTLQVNPNSSGNVSVTFTTVGLWYASIQDQNTSTKIVWSNTSVFAGNPTDWDVQKICTSTENYACWDKTQYQQGDSYVVNYKVQFQSNLMNPATRPNLQFFDPDNKLVKTIKLNFTLFNDTIMGSTSGTFSKSAKTGIWIVKLSNIDDITGDNNGELANSATEVIAVNRTTATTDIPSGSNAVSSVGDNLKILMSQVFFWGLILLIIFTITVYRGKFIDSHRSLAVLAFAFLETIGGLFAPYTLTVFAVLVIIIAISFRKGQETVSGGT